MNDDKTKRHPLDGKRIDLNQPYEVKFWCEEFHVTETKLRQAVSEVGTSAYNVWQFLLKI
ncbi:TPA: hypothetical protein DCR49_12480 [Candidatus Delongbacteria bacterium]|nr:hypothetical protein [Candidatus Delongbacteria bacterium]